MNNNNNEPKSPSLNIDSPKGFIAGMLFGGLAGAGAMLLMAPLSGKHLRAQLQLKGNDIQVQVFSSFLTCWGCYALKAITLLL